MIISSLLSGKVVKRKVDNIAFDEKFDVVVVGAGSSGVFVCDSASKEGLKVLLIEQSKTLGGMHVKGNVTGFYMGSNGGSYESDVIKNEKDDVFYSEESNYEQKQIRVVERLKKCGAKIYTSTVVLGIYFDGSTAPFTIRRQYLQGDRYVTNNGDSAHVNQYDEFDFSSKLISARVSAKKFVTDKSFINLASYAGVREGFTFKGEQTLTHKDFVLRKHTDKALFYAYSDLDKHGYDRAVDDEGFQDWWVISNLSTVAVNVPVPMGAVVPKGVRGLVTAGRCLSTDCYTQGAVRMNKDMFRLGECLGVAISLAVKDKVDLLEIDYQKYHNRVTELGCYIGNADRNYAFQTNKVWYDNKIKVTGKIPDKKYENLSPSSEIYFPVEFDIKNSYDLLYTDEPGVAFWSCYIYKNRKKLANYLYSEMISTENKLYKYNLAIALGLIKDKRCLSTLLEIIENRDCFYFKDNRRSNQFRSVIAVCLLGRLGGIENLSTLDKISLPIEFENKIYHTLEPNYMFHRYNDRNFLYFQMITHTLVSYIKIYKRNAVTNYQKYFTDESVKFYTDKILSGISNAQSIEEVENFFKNACKIK